MTLLVAALSIYMVGGSMAEVLTEAFPSLDELLAASEEQLARVKGFGPKRAKFVHEFFHSPAGERLAAEVRELGLKVNETKKAAPADSGPRPPASGRTGS